MPLLNKVVGSVLHCCGLGLNVSELVAPQVLAGTGCLCFWPKGKLHPPIPLAEVYTLHWANVQWVASPPPLNVQLGNYSGTCVLVL